MGRYEVVIIFYNMADEIYRSKGRSFVGHIIIICCLFWKRVVVVLINLYVLVDSLNKDGGSNESNSPYNDIIITIVWEQT